MVCMLFRVTLLNFRLTLPSEDVVELLLNSDGLRIETIPLVVALSPKVSDGVYVIVSVPGMLCVLRAASEVLVDSGNGMSVTVIDTITKLAVLLLKPPNESPAGVLIGTNIMVSTVYSRIVALTDSRSSVASHSCGIKS